MIVGVGSESELKLRAVRTAFAKLGVDAEIIPCATLSRVPKQPFGFEQIAVGARNRAEQAMRGTDIAIGIENGLVYMEPTQKYYDIPAIFSVTNTGKSSVAFGTGIVIPKVLVERVRKEEREIGEIVAKLGHGGEKDPANYFLEGHLKREEILAQAIVSAVGEVMFPERYEIRN